MHLRPRPGKISDLRVLVVGTTCCDMTNPDFSFLDDIQGDGLVVDSRRMVAVHPSWLKPKKGSWTMGGGTLNIGPLVSLTGVPTGILTSLGQKDKAFDIHGKFILDLMEKTGIYSIIIPNEILPSAASFIKPAQPGSREAILHAPNAVDEFDIEQSEVFEKLTLLPSGAIIHYVYSGLAETMDSQGGTKLARVMKRLKALGHITMVDPHTLSKNPRDTILKGEVIEEYKLLTPVLPHLSWFFSSEVEAMMMATAFGYSIEGKNEETKNLSFLMRLADEFTAPGSPKILGITRGQEVHILYLSPEGTRLGPITVKSRYTISAADTYVGAGDSFRAGFEVEWAKNLSYAENFKAGRISEIELERLCLMGHLLASCYLSRTPANQYGTIPDYRSMKKVVESGESFSVKEALFDALNISAR